MSSNKKSKSDGKGHSKSHSKSDGKGDGKSHSKESVPALPTQNLSIIVYRGDPVDAQDTRHVAFFIEFGNAGNNVLSHVVGAAGFFEHEERWNTTQPYASQHFERSIHVATFQTERNEADTLRIRNELANTPINNSERAWNCQTWVGDALVRLRNVGLSPLEMLWK